MPRTSLAGPNGRARASGAAFELTLPQGFAQKLDDVKNSIEMFSFFPHTWRNKRRTQAVIAARWRMWNKESRQWQRQIF
jgi:hypothetical protein